MWVEIFDIKMKEGYLPEKQSAAPASHGPIDHNGATNLETLCKEAGPDEGQQLLQEMENIAEENI